MRVVLGVSVLISFLLSSPQSPMMRILKMWKEGRFVVLTSPPILEELGKVLLSKKLKRFVKLTEEEAKQYLALVAENSLLLRVKDKVKFIEADPSDNKFLELARVGQADFIITGDKHLLGLKKFGKTAIVSPGKFVKMMRK